MPKKKQKKPKKHKKHKKYTGPSIVQVKSKAGISPFAHNPLVRLGKAIEGGAREGVLASGREAEIANAKRRAGVSPTKQGGDWEKKRTWGQWRTITE